MRKSLRVMDDPVLDRIFSDAYRETLSHVDTLEQQKSLKDRIDALADIFERDLYDRDLTYQEREQFVRAFREYIVDAGEREAERKDRKRRTVVLSLSGMVVAMLMAAAIVLNIYRPFTPRERITGELDQLYEKVDERFGEYSKKYYRVLDRYSRRLGPETTADYELLMHAELEEGFDEYLAQVTEGQIGYYDDGRKWAGYFPEREERQTRRDMLKNALMAGVGGAMEDAAQSLVKGVKDIVGKGAEVIKDRASEIGAGTAGDTADESVDSGEPGETAEPEGNTEESSSF